MSRTVQVHRDLAYLEESWPHVVNCKLPGTARSWVETPQVGELSPEAADRLGKKGVPRAAPAAVFVLDLLADYARIADDVARTVVDVADLGAQFLPLNAASKDPRPWLHVIATWVSQAHDRDDKTIPWVAAMIYPIVSSTARLLGDVRSGQVLNGVCPWCQGRTATGLGERTLQIRYPDPDDKDDEPLIFCFGVNCRPPSAACGQQWRGHPAWLQREWNWLAEQLIQIPSNRTREAV
ncbi:hypothetical protein ACTHQY_15025 [Rhodococcoides corynebacterioides]|uniref:hypothetical protein n=1 Tax=Rhodococcoides corynebacterioides TaxID=53972 RepID=UPI003F7E4314